MGAARGGSLKGVVSVLGRTFGGSCKIGWEGGKARGGRGGNLQQRRGREPVQGGGCASLAPSHIPGALLMLSNSWLE